ncbi:MAG: polyketide cyclase [Streptosporangiales bacterium]|nr:polyketide cyclase [Streptosporangiales bacterium]
MTEDRIERETLIAASQETVWALVAKPGFWVADETSLAGVVAQEGASMVAKNAEHGDFPVRVEKVDPPAYVAYRWVSAFPGEELREENSTLVEFTLTTEGDKTRLRVVESGLATLAGPEEMRRSVLEDHSTGWAQCFDALKTRAEESSV